MKKIIIAASLIAASSASAQIVNGDFSLFTSTGSSSYTSEVSTGIIHDMGSINSWNIIGKSTIYQIRSGDDALYVSGSNTAGDHGASQKFNVATAGLYTLSFDSFTAATAGTAYLTASLGGVSNDYKESSDSAITARSFQVNLSAGSNVVQFVNQGSSDKEFLIDNVKLTAVPEPSSTALLGLGALGLLIRRKR